MDKSITVTTRSGETTFRNRNTIIATTRISTTMHSLEVHLESGTIFTVIAEEASRFINWLEMREI